MNIYISHIFYYIKNDQGFIEEPHFNVQVFKSVDDADMYLDYWKDTHTVHVENGWYEADLIEKTV